MSGSPIDESLPSLPVGLFHADTAGRVTAANAAFVALVHGNAFSGGPSPTSIVGSAPWSTSHPADRAAAEHAWRQGVAGGQPFKVEYRVWRDDGRLTWVRLDTAPSRNEHGVVIGYTGSISDHTDEVGGRDLLDQLTSLAAATTDGIFVLDRTGTPMFANEAARRLFGIDGADGHTGTTPLSQTLLQSVKDQVPRAVMTGAGSAQWSGEVGYRTPDGIARTLEVDVLVSRGPDGAVEYWGGVARDVTAIRHLQSELARQANHDALTNLPNRLMLLRAAAEAVDHHRGSRENIAMLFLDVDRLKDVNDTVGHEVGDQLLIQVANRVLHATRPADLVARIGGDEFVVLCVGAIDEQSALDLAERIRQALSGRVMLSGVEVDLSVSIGVAIGAAQQYESVSGQDAAIELLRNADLAMYHAKRQGPSRSELYTDEMRGELRRAKQLSGDLELALAAGQLRLAYQPIISTHSGRVAGAEALLRWDHPAHGTMLPADFLRLAEDSGTIVPIGDWVIRQACTDARAWLDAGLVDRGFSVHVNVAARQLVESTFVEKVSAIVRHADLSPHQLTLDFDEATLDDRHPSTLRTLQALRRFGVQLGLDSFGTGVSSLTALRTCQADVLKLDGSIARLLGTSGDDDPIVRAIIQLAHALDMQVVAEWVTSADQLRRLRLLGCDLVQGHLLGEPAGAEAFGERARR
ncbi:MAG: putative bifunctional diguanylate cyclase/phosphodiesterase [Ilumatobacteraceae bacterium]